MPMPCTLCDRNVPTHCGMCRECELAKYGGTAFGMGPAEYDAAEHREETVRWIEVQANQDRWGTSGNVSY